MGDYENMIIVCACITIIGYLTYRCTGRFHSTIKLIPIICWLNSVENWFTCRCDSTEHLNLWDNNYYFCDHDMAIFYWVPNESKSFCVGCSIITPSDILYPTSNIISDVRYTISDIRYTISDIWYDIRCRI